jgi:hypothetical protein
MAGLSEYTMRTRKVVVNDRMQRGYVYYCTEASAGISRRRSHRS